MAKALIGYLNSDLRTPGHVALENTRLKARVRELEDLVLKLKLENDTLVARAAELVEASMQEIHEMQEMQEMQPA